MTQAALYRHFDAEGRLLYVGVSARPLARLAAHRRTSPWGAQIAAVKLRWFASKEAAHEAERVEVRTARPIHNKNGRYDTRRGKPVVHHDLISEIREICEQTGMALTIFGKAAINDPCLFADLLDGRELRGRTFRRVRRFMDALAESAA